MIIFILLLVRFHLLHKLMITFFWCKFSSDQEKLNIFILFRENLNEPRTRFGSLKYWNQVQSLLQKQTARYYFQNHFLPKIGHLLLSEC